MTRMSWNLRCAMFHRGGQQLGQCRSRSGWPTGLIFIILQWLNDGGSNLFARDQAHPLHSKIHSSRACLNKAKSLNSETCKYQSWGPKCILLEIFSSQTILFLFSPFHCFVIIQPFVFVFLPLTSQQHNFPALTWFDLIRLWGGKLN